MQWPRDNFWVYGVVEPLSGWHFEQEGEHLNSQHFQTFLDALSLALGDDIALIQLDRAKWMTINNYTAAWFAGESFQ